MRGTKLYSYKDLAALELLLGTELVYVDYDGKLMDKAEYLASVQAPSLRPTRIVTESMKVHLYGAAAMINGVPGRRFKR